MRPPTRTLLWTLCCIAFALSAALAHGGEISAQVLGRPQVLSATSLSAADAARPGEGFRAAVRVEMASDALHINAHKPRDEFSVPTECLHCGPGRIRCFPRLFTRPPRRLRLKGAATRWTSTAARSISAWAISVAESVVPGDYTL